MNEKVIEIINKCLAEIEDIKRIKESEGSTSDVMRYLTCYSAVKFCSSIESALKSIVEDVILVDSNPRVKKCIKERIIEKQPINPTYDNIRTLLNLFDENWSNRFKESFVGPHDEKIKSSLYSLNQNRHKFAHGVDITASFDDISGYFNDSKEVLEKIFNIVSDSEREINE